MTVLRGSVVKSLDLVLRSTHFLDWFYLFLPMKLRITIILTIALLSLVVGAGVLSAFWGFAIGREALQGVTQPDVRPANPNQGRDDSSVIRTDSVEFLREEDILKQVEAQIAEPNRGLGTN